MKQYVADNYSKMIKIINCVEHRRRIRIAKLMEDLSDKIFTAPASYKISQYSCYPGGLANHTIKVMQNMLKMVNSMKIKYSRDSIILVALFHDVGKIGDRDDDYYIMNDDYWKSRGFIYRINEKFDKIPIHMMSLYLLQKYEIRLERDEYNAISSYKNNSYDTLTTLLQTSIQWAINQEKQEKINFEEESKQQLPQISNDIQFQDGIVQFEDAIKMHA